MRRLLWQLPFADPQKRALAAPAAVRTSQRPTVGSEVDPSGDMVANLPAMDRNRDHHEERDSYTDMDCHRRRERRPVSSHASFDATYSPTRKWL
jgi:hypothetical protein